MPERPRLCLFRSQKHLYAQIVDDVHAKTLLGCSTGGARLKEGSKSPRGVAAAERLGAVVASEAAKQGITRVVFDRGGYLYHGRVKAFAEAVRTGGIQV